MRRTPRRRLPTRRMFWLLSRSSVAPFTTTPYKTSRRASNHTRVQHRNASHLMRKTLPSKRQPLYDAQLAIFQEVRVPAVRKQAISLVFAIVLVTTLALAGFAQQKQKDHKQKDDAAASSNTSNTSTTTVDPKLYGAMKWRLIGPFRGGRVLAATR